MTWLLVLTILFSHGTSVAQVGPFANEAACMSAANTWLKQTGAGANYAAALCVRQQ